MIRPGAIGLGALATLLVALSASSAPAKAQSGSPSPAKGPSVSGQISGSLAKGSSLSIRVDATMPEGWERLHLVDVVIRSGSRTLEELVYDIEGNELMIAGQSVIIGTGSVGSGKYLRMSGADVILTTVGRNLSLRINADVVKTISDGARFDMGVVSDSGETATATESLVESESGGITWGTMIAALLIAVLAGVVIGNLFASKRRPPARLSLYATIDQRLRAERESASDP